MVKTNINCLWHREHYKGFGDATPILDTDVYFYVTENGYVAKWQYKDFVVSLTSNESLSTFIRKVEIIMEENLT